MSSTNRQRKAQQERPPEPEPAANPNLRITVYCDGEGEDGTGCKEQLEINTARYGEGLLPPVVGALVSKEVTDSGWTSIVIQSSDPQWVGVRADYCPNCWGPAAQKALGFIMVPLTEAEAADR